MLYFFGQILIAMYKEIKNNKNRNSKTNENETVVFSL